MLPEVPTLGGDFPSFSGGCMTADRGLVTTGTLSAGININMAISHSCWHKHKMFDWMDLIICLILVDYSYYLSM